MGRKSKEEIEAKEIENKIMSKLTDNLVDESIKILDDKIKSPNHYKVGNWESIEILRAWLTPQEFRGFLKGNAFKYLIRFEKKNGIEDIMKCQMYLKWLAEEMENEQK